jgi:secreted trypsin-like serine protease
MNPALPRSSSSRLRLATVLTGCVAALVLFLAACSQQALASSGGAGFETGGSLIPQGPLVPQIIGGRQASISEFPWQVWVLLTFYKEGFREGESSCGGSILNATTILTAAHCTDHDGTTTPYEVPSSEAEILVVAGASEGLRFRSESPDPSPATSQQDFVTSVRRDPNYAVKPEVKDDVAVLTLEKPLTLSAADNTAAIPLVPAGATPAPGTTLSISGYGKEVGTEGVNSNGDLFSTTLTAISSDACRKVAGEINSAVLLCAESATSTTCQGDSGGPLTEGSPAVEVGTVDFGEKECPVNAPDVFTNLAAPEIRDFIEGNQSPPLAARPTSPPVIKSVGTVPVALSPLTCEPGAWSGSPTFTYTFQVENASAQVLQNAPGNIFTPPSSLVGSPLVCIVQASNPGGVTTVRSATTPSLVADTTPPVSAITGLKCKLQVCTLSFTASDPNGVALTVSPSVAYSVVAKCPKKKKKKKGKKPAKPPVCHKTATLNMSPLTISAGSFQAAVSRLPYGETITFDLAVSNAAGLKAAAASTHTTLHKPKPKPKKPKKKKKKKKH